MRMSFENFGKFSNRVAYERILDESIDFTFFTDIVERGNLPTVEDVMFPKAPAELGDIGFSDTLMSTITRRKYTERYGFVLVTSELVEELAKFLKGKNVLEVMSGSGYLAYNLQKAGVNIKATDTKAWARGTDIGYFRHEFLPIEEIEATAAIEKYKDWADVVLMCWPPYHEPHGYNVATACKCNQIDLLYNGEDWGGCTANSDFFELIDEDKCSSVADNVYVTWDGIYDYFQYIPHEALMSDEELRAKQMEEEEEYRQIMSSVKEGRETPELDVFERSK